MQDISSKHSHADVQVSWLGSTQWGSFLLCSPLFKCKKEFKRKGLYLCSVVQYFYSSCSNFERLTTWSKGHLRKFFEDKYHCVFSCMINKNFELICIWMPRVKCFVIQDKIFLLPFQRYS